RSLCYCSSAAREGRRGKVPVLRRTGESPSLDRIRSAPQALEASGASRRLFYAAASKWHWSLKTQQRAFTSRPHRLVGFAHGSDEASSKTRRPSATPVAVRKTL